MCNQPTSISLEEFLNLTTRADDVLRRARKRARRLRAEAWLTALTERSS